MTPETIAARRADIDAKQTALIPILNAMGVESVLFFMPAHVAWFTGGMNVGGLLADSERPGIYSNGRQRWLICSNVDTQRLFDEELDCLGFQVKEWHWEAGRSDTLVHLTAWKKVAADRPFPNIPMINDRMRPLLRVLSAFEQEQYLALGRAVAHAVEATARNCAQGQTEEKIAGQVGHRLLHHGIEPAVISVTADGRGDKYRRTGTTDTPATQTAVIMATGQRNGLYATCSRTVSFGPLPDEFRQTHDYAVKQAALFRSLTRSSTTISAIGVAGRTFLERTPYEFDWRLAPPGYATGRFPAEELRKSGQEDSLMPGMAVVWQPRVGPAAVIDTLTVADGEPVVVTPAEEWPVKRLIVSGGPPHDIPDVLVREAEQ